MHTQTQKLLPNPTSVPKGTFHGNAKNLLGRKLGTLTILEEAGRNSKGSLVWRCRCDCGNVVLRRGSALLRRVDPNCGCKTAEKMALALVKPGTPMRTAYKQYLNQARQRGRIFDLTEEEFAKLVQLPCAYCGVIGSMLKATKYDEIRINGLDRIDSSRGYFVENCDPCCPRCNRMKLDMGPKEFLEHVHRIAQWRPQVRSANAS